MASSGICQRITCRPIHPEVISPNCVDRGFQGLGLRRTWQSQPGFGAFRKGFVEVDVTFYRGPFAKLLCPQSCPCRAAIPISRRRRPIELGGVRRGFCVAGVVGAIRVRGTICAARMAGAVSGARMRCIWHGSYRCKVNLGPSHGSVLQLFARNCFIFDLLGTDAIRLQLGSGVRAATESYEYRYGRHHVRVSKPVAYSIHPQHPSDNASLVAEATPIKGGMRRPSTIGRERRRHIGCNAPPAGRVSQRLSAAL